MTAEAIRGRLVLDDAIVPGEIRVDDGVISAVEPDGRGSAGPLLAPGFIDVHVHGWGGHSAMGDAAALDGMARALLRQGVTSFLPTAWTEPIPELAEFAERLRTWIPAAPRDGSSPLGFNLEGPFLSEAKKGAHDPAKLRAPADVADSDLEPLLDGLRLITIAPEVPGALDLIARLTARGVRVSLGHSAATLAEANAGYAAGATTTTHLFNAMSGVDHHHPGLAVAALSNDDAYVELIADGNHVDPSLLPIITRSKPPSRLMLVSDALSLAGTGLSRATLGGLEVEIVGGRVTLAGTSTLAGCVIALDTAVRNVTSSGIPLPAAIAAAATNPAAMLGQADRGRIAVGLRADLVELDDGLRVRRVMRAGEWFEGAGTS
ncbi:MAG TPA: N-acetylglucosamine-6-phosphate deacetylase [Candidatus Limnocylindrales bacterium]|nr:N-acetylglucosamine-6-phosphate deacetylase [Candidatus Limnocylindrales bacterium]